MPKTLSLTSIAYTLWPMECPKRYKDRSHQQQTNITPISSPTITETELTAVKIIKAAITNHLNLRTPPLSPQPTIPLPTFPLTIVIPSPQDSTVHINLQDPSPFT